jgi:DNA adenine methylase
MKSFLKWVGSKRKLLGTLLPYFPQVIEGVYYEPFLGSGAVFFALKERQPNLRAVLSDVNPDLMITYQQVRDNPQELIQWLHLYAQNHQEDPIACFAQIRSQDRHGYDKLPSVCKAARLIYLNRTCFNGLWRVNARGYMNAPMGGYDQPAICNIEVLMACHKALQGVDLLCQPYDEISPLNEDWVYVDPPYCDTYNGYKPGGFGRDDTTFLSLWCHHRRESGVHVIASNSNVDYVRECWQGWEFQEVKRPGTMNSDITARQPVSELIISGV